jgi:hypothetical protein
MNSIDTGAFPARAGGFFAKPWLPWRWHELQWHASHSGALPPG